MYRPLAVGMAAKYRCRVYAEEFIVRLIATIDRELLWGSLVYTDLTYLIAFSMF